MRISWVARRTNISVLEEIKPTCPLETIITKQKLAYFGHIMRAKESLEKCIMLGMGNGGRKRGKPRARWMDDIEAVTGSSLSQLREDVRDRDQWRQKVTGITRRRTRLDGTR